MIHGFFPLLAEATSQASDAALASGMKMTLISISYLLASAAFIFAMKWLSSPTTARRGVILGGIGMALAVLGTLFLHHDIHSKAYFGIFIALIIGSGIGVPLAWFTPTTALPQQTALSHAFGGLAAGLVGIAEYSIWSSLGPASGIEMSKFLMFAIGFEVTLGLLTFTGSIVAFAKLQEKIGNWKLPITPQPMRLPYQNFITLGTIGLAAITVLVLMFAPGQVWLVGLLVIVALFAGVLLVAPIGGGDMPTVISLLNSYAGISTCAMGFVLNNHLLIVAGAANGSSGFILSVIMCKAMNRSFANVLFGGFGAVQAAAAAGPAKPHKSLTAEEAAFMLKEASSVVIVPGYGMAVAQAQHRVKELYEILTKSGINVRFAIHPVAGRMPGHMNVLLAEADIPYDKLFEMDDINADLPQTDISLIIGANDTVNPAARHDKNSPIFGMPILDVDKSGTVMVIKRSMNVGFAGIDNELFYLDNTYMLFGDAKAFVSEIIKQLQGGGGH